MKQNNKTTKPFCILESVIGNVIIDIKPNQYYAYEVILNGKRINLPNGIIYKNIKKIILYSMSPLIGTIYTNNNNEIAVIYRRYPYSDCFEPLQDDTSL